MAADARQVRWLKRALANLEAEAEYIAGDNRAAAARTVAVIGRCVERLARFPDSGRAGRVDATRELIVPGTPYIVVYRVRDAVEILRLFHASRKWPPAR